MENETPTTVSLEQWRDLNKQMADLREKYEQCKGQLVKYTNKDRVKENAKAYLNKLKEENPDKLKEYRRRAYVKRKNQNTENE